MNTSIRHLADKLTLFKEKSLVMTKKRDKFASNYEDEPTALAFTDFTDKDADDDEPTALANSSNPYIPVLEGEAAERFLDKMQKAEEEYERRKKIPPTLEELKKRLSFDKIMLNYKEREINELKESIKKLEEQINGKISEQD